MTSGARLLVVDDDRAVRSALRVNLSKAGYEVVLAENAEEALAVMTERPCSLVLSDVKMPGGGGSALLQSVKAQWPTVPVVMMTGGGSIEDAVHAMRSGAADYIIKPVSKDELLVILERALRNRALEKEVVQLRAELADRYGFERVIGQTSAMREVYTLVSAVATSDALVLITGPTGTGKELIAHAIHYRSPRHEGAFVGVNCAALPEGLLESELFGHEKGAFTGAVRQHRGRFEQAAGGTLLLDEIGEIPLATQVRLLRVLESGELQRVGGSEVIRVDVRVVAATNRDLRKEVREGRFREDLYYRLNVFHIPLPALHQRRDDIPLLVEHFIQRFAVRHQRPARRVSPAALEAMLAYSWPGNVRELEHTLERAVILSPGEEITDIRLGEEEAVPATPRPPALPEPTTCSGTLGAALEVYERRLIIDALRKEDGVQARAAKLLGISRSNLNYRIHRLGISRREVIYD